MQLCTCILVVFLDYIWLVGMYIALVYFHRNIKTLFKCEYVVQLSTCAATHRLRSCKAEAG